MADPTATPPAADPVKVVSPNLAAAAIVQFAAQAGLFMTGGAAALAFARHGDIAGFIAWAQTQVGAGYLALMGGGILVVWRQAHAAAQRLWLIRAARAKPGTVVVVKGDVFPQ